MRGPEAASLATQFGITAKAVRDVWNLRTWAKTTMPFWTQADLNTRLCKECRSRKIRSLPEACDTCSKPPTRGHPRIQRVKLALDIGDLILQSNYNENDVIAFCGTEHDEGAVGATCQTRKLWHHQTLLACDDGDGVLPYNEEQEIIL